MILSRFTGLTSLACLALGAAACITVPDVIIADRATVLEQQAAGDFQPLARDLRRAAIIPGGEPFGPGDLPGGAARTGDLDELLRIDAAPPADAEQIDALLVERCIGESSEGLLVPTEATCQGEPDVEAAMRLLERANRDRRQLWAWIDQKRPASDVDAVRKQWRVFHLMTTPCGANLQVASGDWEAKRCE